MFSTSVTVISLRSTKSMGIPLCLQCLFSRMFDLNGYRSMQDGKTDNAVYVSLQVRKKRELKSRIYISTTILHEYK